MWAAINWVTSILASSSSKVILNGRAGTGLQHDRGLRHGNPLTPLLLVLAIDPLQKLLSAAQQTCILLPLHRRRARFNIAWYADDAVVSTRPDKQELQAVHAILQHFGRATRMITNQEKSKVYAFRWDDHNLQDILSRFPAQQKTFPSSYLGLLLHIRKLRKLDVQPLKNRQVRSQTTDVEREVS